MIDFLEKKIESVDYICYGVEFDYREGEYLYFDAVDLASCDLTVRVKIDRAKRIGEWEISESYGDEWN